MPRGDGTGPWGTGPIGRGRGGCLGFGFGRGMRGGMGRGSGFACSAPMNQDTVEDQVARLEEQAANLRSQTKPQGRVTAK